MRNISIQSITAQGILQDIATVWHATVLQNREQYTVEIPSTWGRGSIAAYELNDGMILLQYDCNFLDDVHFDFFQQPSYSLILNYCTFGELKARFHHMEDCGVAEKYQSLILVNQDHKGYNLQFKKDTETKARSILIDRKDFNDSFKIDEYSLEPYYKELFEESEKDDSYYRNHMYSVVLSHYFDLIDNSSYEGLVKALQVKGLVLQILSEQLKLYEDDLKNDGTQDILRQYEILCINQAAMIIEGELEELATIPNIAHRVGINVNKLQDGFRLIYQNTVNGYVNDVRMKRGAYLLHYSDHSISEIVTKVGLNSKSYFSKIFKEQYGITPSDYRKNKQDGHKIAAK